MTRVLALTIRPLDGPDTRYRILEYIPHLEKAGIEVVHNSLLSRNFYRRQQARKLNVSDALSFIAAALGRAAGLLRHLSFDAVWLARELLPYGPPLLERLLFQTGVPVVLDVDDALFEPDPAGGFLHRNIRDFTKYAYIVPRCRTVVAGNRYLADYFSRLNVAVEIIPTCVDHLKYAGIARRPSPDDRIRLGWIGTPANRGHLDLIRTAVERLARHHPLEFRAVGLGSPLGWDMDRCLSIPWRLPEELDYFTDFDIGVMPLADTAFTRGKCAFKIIQYMAAGVPVAASPVAANREVMIAGEQGFFAEEPQEWERVLETLILDKELCRRMGESGRTRVREKFSLAAHWSRYADILRGR
ncbi:MAG: glycosyltransferase family 4 protein [Planctomycetota bacterium]|jgi:glycosyltransferase involved in cell wall biosynthesis|nr:glycosyltransferase family 4 protein [Planctomycetota bacterium]